MLKKAMVLLGVVAIGSTSIGGCHDSSSSKKGVAYVQIERLARPAINEALFFTNDFLNALNEITPAEEPGALVGALAAEAIAVISAVDLLDGSDDVVDGDVIAALIPDVMRIDTTIASPVGVGAYANGAIPFGTFPRPVAGRKIEDDVIDITLTLLAGSAVSDGVGYTGVAGNEAQPGHQLLNGQAAPLGAATFPFLAPPN